MKTAYVAVLKALVTDKTITQAQSDKVLIAVTENLQAGGGGQKPDDAAQTDGAKPDDQAKADGRMVKNNKLSELVTSKVITQAEADTINQKLQEAKQ